MKTGAGIGALRRHLDPELFRALCDPRRLAILMRLAAASRPLTVSEAAAESDVHLSGVSRHLSLLRRVGVLACERRGREVVYQLSCGGLVRSLRAIADALEACCPSAHQGNRHV